MSAINNSPLRPDDPNTITNFYAYRFSHSTPKKKLPAWAFGLACAALVILAAVAIYLVFIR